MVILGYCVCLMFLLVLLLLGCLYSRVHWSLKAVLLVSSLSAVGIFALTLGAQLGWPTDRPPPPQFRFLASDIHEPAAYRGDTGAIYLWYRPMVGEAPPRAVRLPYSKRTKDAMRQATARSRTGMAVYMSMHPEPHGTAAAPAAGSATTGQPGRPGAGGQTATSNVFDFIPPPDTLPQKTSRTAPIILPSAPVRG